MRAAIGTLFLLYSALAYTAQNVSLELIIEELPFRVVSSPSGIDCPGTCSATFYQTDTVVLTATPEFPFRESFFFVKWGGYCTDISPTCTIKEQGRYSITAELLERTLGNLFSPSPVLVPEDDLWPIPRYFQGYDQDLYRNGIIRDFLTGLLWMQEANCMQTHYSWLDWGAYGQTDPGDPNEHIDYPGDGAVDWQSAIDFVNGINSGNYPSCVPQYDSCIEWGGYWSLPTKDELESLVDERFPPPRISNSVGDSQTSDGDPFLNISTGYYWSKTEYLLDPPLDPNEVWVGSVSEGIVKRASRYGDKDFHFVWPVCRNARPPL